MDAERSDDASTDQAEQFWEEHYRRRDRCGPDCPMPSWPRWPGRCVRATHWTSAAARAGTRSGSPPRGGR